MRDAWQDFLSRLSGPHVNFGFDDVARWEKTDFQALCDLDLLSDAKPASYILCPECSGHWAEVTSSTGGTRAFIVCTREGRPVDVDPAHLREWEPNKERFVSLLATGLGIVSRPLNFVAGQLWRLGRCRFGGRDRDIFFSAIAPDDVSSMVSEIRREYGSVAGVLLLPSCAPDPGQNSKLRTIDLSNITALRRDRIIVTVAFIEEQFTDDSRANSKESQPKSPPRALKVYRMGILKAHAPEIKEVSVLAGHFNVSTSALYGMIRNDRSRYSPDKLEMILSKIGCSRKKWNRAPKPTSRT